jgi:hypothetical protein
MSHDDYRSWQAASGIQSLSASPVEALRPLCVSVTMGPAGLYLLATYLTLVSLLAEVEGKIFLRNVC